MNRVIFPRARYLLRLDDACPTMDSARWGELEKLLHRHGITPIVSIVPANGDPDLVRSTADTGFWDRAREWRRAGWMIGMHGYSHDLRPSPLSLVPIKKYSEFAGLPEQEQRRRIREGAAILEEQGLAPEVWVAPAHGFDRATLRSLLLESTIRIISDGLSTRPFRRWGFTWLPQQLWRPRPMTGGLWTICLHPNEIDGAALELLEAFISARRDAFDDPRSAAGKAAGFCLADVFACGIFAAGLWLNRITKTRPRVRVPEKEQR